MASSTAITLYSTTPSPAATLILAHGAGAGQHSPFIVRIARALAEERVTVATFDFPYMAARRRAPDKAPVLERAWREAIDAVRVEHSGPLFIGGKSMGGRIASHVAAQGVAGVAGLIFLGYPLHPPGRPQQRRDAHLPSITQPMLFVQGERDDFGTVEEIRELLPRLNDRTVVHPIAGGDHSLKVPARQGITADAVLQDVVGAVVRFIGASTVSAAPSADPR